MQQECRLTAGQARQHEVTELVEVGQGEWPLCTPQASDLSPDGVGVGGDSGLVVDPEDARYVPVAGVALAELAVQNQTFVGHRGDVVVTDDHVRVLAGTSERAEPVVPVGFGDADQQDVSHIRGVAECDLDAGFLHAESTCCLNALASAVGHPEGVLHWAAVGVQLDVAVGGPSFEDVGQGSDPLRSAMLVDDLSQQCERKALRVAADDGQFGAPRQGSTSECVGLRGFLVDGGSCESHCVAPVAFTLKVGS